MSQIALTLYNLRDYCKTESDLATTFATIKKIGYNNVQISAVPLEAEVIRKLLDEYELKCCATHDSFDLIFGDVNAICDRLDTLGCDYTALGSPPAAYYSHEGMKLLAQKFSAQGEKMAARGKKIAYHNHHLEFCRCQGECTVLDTFYNNTNPEFVQAELDLMWIARAGASPVDYIKRLKNRVDIIHFKDFTITNDGKNFWQNECTICEVGEGNLDWKNIVPECKNSGVKFYIVEQDEPFNNRNIFDSMKISFDNIKKMGIN